MEMFALLMKPLKKLKLHQHNNFRRFGCLKKYRIELSIKAKNDIKSIVLYIKNNLNEPSIANKYAKMIKEEIKTLEYSPKKFAIIDGDTIKDLKIRKLNIRNYLAFYRVNEEEKVVNVERILYGSSDWINRL